jgi:ferredoxin-thioredoxin reductase catalytic chain
MSLTNPAQAATQATEKNLEMMRGFAESYAKRTGTYFCSDLGVTAVVLEGLAKHKDDLGAALCPCRHYEDKEAEAKATYWNCPCVPMRERKECHCMLFLTSDNAFAGAEQAISFDQIRAVTDESKV